MGQGSDGDAVDAGASDLVDVIEGDVARGFEK